MLRVLRGLQARGLVGRTPAPASRRNVAVALLPEGEKLLGEAQEPADRAYGRLMTPPSPEQDHQLVALLLQLTEGLEDHARAAFVPLDQNLAEFSCCPAGFPSESAPLHH